MESKKKTEVNTKFFILTVILLFLLNILVWLIYFKKTVNKETFQTKPQELFKETLTSISGSKITPSPTPLPTFTPTPIPIPHGKINFTIGTSDKNAPAVRQGFIDPYDPQIGQRQTIGINVNNIQPATSIDIILKTDHQTKTYPMKIVEKTTDNTRWETKWTVEDSYLYTYIATIRAVGPKGVANIDYTMR